MTDNGGVIPGNNKPVAETNSTLFYSLIVVLEVLGLTCIVLVVVWCTKYLDGFGSWDGSSKEFNYHPVFMTVGMVFILGNSAVSYRVLKYTDKSIVKIIHTCLHCCSFIFCTLGLVTVFDYHNKHGITNMYSIHSWVGIGTVVLFACQLVIGFLGFLFPKFSEEHRSTYLKIHVFFGKLILVLAVVACISGITEKMFFVGTYSKFIGVGNIANSLGVCLIVFTLVVWFILSNPSYKRTEVAYQQF